MAPAEIGSGLAADLMRRDEEFLRATAADAQMRGGVYRFARPSVTAGRNARVADTEIERWRALDHDFARRPTGGGIIRHGGDLSFGWAFPDDGSFASTHMRRVADALRTALAEQSIETAFPSGRVETPARCFQAAVGVELTYLGEKLVGLASRRVRGAVLVQGSLAVERDPERDLEILGLGPRVDLSGTAFDPTLFAVSMRRILFSDAVRDVESAP